MDIKDLSLAYMRDEATNEYYLLINSDRSFIGRELEIFLSEENKIEIQDHKNSISYVSNKIDDEMVNVIRASLVKTIFIDDDGNQVGGLNLDLRNPDVLNQSGLKRKGMNK